MQGLGRAEVSEARQGRASERGEGASGRGSHPGQDPRADAVVAVAVAVAVVVAASRGAIKMKPGTGEWAGKVDGGEGHD